MTREASAACVLVTLAAAVMRSGTQVDWPSALRLSETLSLTPPHTGRHHRHDKTLVRGGLDRVCVCMCVCVLHICVCAHVCLCVCCKR